MAGWLFCAVRPLPVVAGMRFLPQTGDSTRNKGNSATPLRHKFDQRNSGGCKRLHLLHMREWRPLEDHGRSDLKPPSAFVSLIFVFVSCLCVSLFVCLYFFCSRFSRSRFSSPCCGLFFRRSLVRLSRFVFFSFSLSLSLSFPLSLSFSFFVCFLFLCIVVFYPLHVSTTVGVGTAPGTVLRLEWSTWSMLS